MKTVLLLPCILLLIIQVRSTNAGANVKAADNFFVQKYADISAPRGLFLDSAGDILVLSKFSSAITTLSEIPNKDGTVYVAKHLILPGSNLNLTHGVAFYNGFVYASSASEVYRWPYVAGTRTLISAPAEVVIKNLPSGGYSTRTLVFHPVTPHTLYVSIGSLENVDPNADRAKILEFNVANIPDGGFDGSSSSVTVFASGLRNTVGLGFDSLNVLWGVDNSVENLYRADLGADIHNTNPAEELNKLTSKNFYGYPYCFSSFDILNTKPRNTQFAWPTFQVDGVHTDEWCEAVTNNAKPVLAMPAHTAPLGIEFYKYCLSESEGGFNCSFQGNAFIAHHGSVNSNKRVGYRVTRVEFNKSGMPTGTIGDVVFAGDIDTCDPSSTCFRPVNAIFDRNGYLIVSADTTGEIFRVSYGSAPPPISGSAMGLTVSTFATALIILLGISMNI